MSFTLECVNDGTTTPKAHTSLPALRFVAAALIVRDREVLIGQRRADQPMASLWEFPGGKVEEGEPVELALTRELHEELNINLRSYSLYFQQQNRYPDGGIFDVSYYLVDDYSGEIQNNVFENILWIPIAELEKYDTLQGNKEVVQMLIKDYAKA